MKNKKQALAAMMRRIKEATDKLEVGGRYFLSAFHDKSGAFVEVLAKSKKINRCGWPSTVTVRVLEQVGCYESLANYYRIGREITCNATNLYRTRASASVDAKRAAHILRKQLEQVREAAKLGKTLCGCSGCEALYPVSQADAECPKCGGYLSEVPECIEEMLEHQIDRLS